LSADVSTVTFDAPSTTWKFVTTTPSDRTTNPVPSPVPFVVVETTFTTAGNTLSTTRTTPPDAVADEEEGNSARGCAASLGAGVAVVVRLDGAGDVHAAADRARTRTRGTASRFIETSRSSDRTGTRCSGIFRSAPERRVRAP
jgi:hypothetical protein